MKKKIRKKELKNNSLKELKEKVRLKIYKVKDVKFGIRGKNNSGESFQDTH